MPIVRIGERLHFFAHVPKCAGTSVERYLEDRFGPLAFMNRRFLSDAEPRRWSKSSPQHIPLDAFRKLVPKSWIASSFAVVRHPMRRFASTFGFQTGHEGTVPPDWTIDRFFDDWMARKETAPFLYDGHLLPQSDLVPEDAAIFRIEDGFDGLIAHLDMLAGNSAGPRQIPAANVGASTRAGDPTRQIPSPDTLAGLATYYAADFHRFGYDPEAPVAHKTPEPERLSQRLADRLRRLRLW